jgi:hypothetical protein
MPLDWILDKVKEEEETECCSGQRVMHIHGGGQATSAPNSQNGSTTTSKVIIYCFILCITFHVKESDQSCGFFNHDS